MKNITIIITIILALGVFLIISPVMAENRVNAFEMGESGQIVEFTMTAEEIADKHAEKERLAAIREAKAQRPKQRLKIYEMGESGQMVSFPLTADEIAAEDTEIARLKAVQNIRVPKSESDFVIFELAESGETIEFPVKGVKILTEGIAKNGATVEADEENTPNN
jgi:hypothetical protein